VDSFIETWDRHYGKPERLAVAPPAVSADAAAIAAVAAKNAQIVGGLVLGLHGPAGEGFEAARKLMTHFVDWNEVRVARTPTLVSALGRLPRADARIALLQRFLETYFLRQRSMNLDYLFTLKPAEVKRFIGELEVFDREEFAAFMLNGFKFALFPPSDVLRDVAEAVGLIKPKTTALQMAKRFESGFEEEILYPLCSHLYALANDPERESLLARHKKKK
jgi:hypothetical protein